MEKQTIVNVSSSSCANFFHDECPTKEKLDLELERHLYDGAKPSKSEASPTELPTNASQFIPTKDKSTSNTSLLNDAVIKYENEKKCDDVYDSTVAICHIFSSTSNKKNIDEEDQEIVDIDRHSTPDNSGEILITDLDSLSCDMKIDSDKERQLHLDLDTSNHSVKNALDLSNNNNNIYSISRSMSPQILLLDVHSQDEYHASYFMNKTGKIKVEDEEKEFFSTEPIRTAHDNFYFENEPSGRICEDSTFFHNQSGLHSPEFIHSRKFDAEQQNSPIFFHDLNYDYDQVNSKPMHKTGDKETECDSILNASEGYSHSKNEITTSLSDKFSYVSPHMSENSNSNVDFGCQYFDLKVNDSGFIDASHISSEKNEPYNGRKIDLSVKTTKQVFGTPKCNLSDKYFDAYCSPHCESILPSNSKLSGHFGGSYENQMLSKSVSLSPPAPLTTLCFPNHPGLSNALLYKSPMGDGGSSSKHGLMSYSDLSETCSLSGCPDWNTWSNGSSQELGLIAVPPPFVNAPLPQAKYFWHGDYNKMESSEMYHHEYLKPIVNDNDSEETDDADEIDDVPLFLNSSNIYSGQERHCPSFQNFCHSEVIPGPPQYGSDVLTPPSSMSNTSTNSTRMYLSPQLNYNKSKPLGVKLESTVTSYEIGPTPKLPYPSMADMMRSSRSNSTKSSGVIGKQIFADTGASVGRFRKNQIQSDTISTSTPKSTRPKRKWTASMKKDESDDVDDLFINLDRLEEVEQNHGPRRHNEPLKQHAIDIMSQWYEEHLDNPYPTKADKLKMASDGGVTVTQVKSWFANKRNRSNNTKPKVQKRVMEEKLKELFNDITCNRSLPLADNSHIIEQLSGIIQTCHSNKNE